MARLVLAVLFSGLMLNVAQAAESEGRRMLVFAIYGAASTTGSAATTTVIDFTTMVACREARVALQHDEHLKTPGFHVFATCVEPCDAAARGRFARAQTK
jgi:hypothetical protein